MEAAVEAAGGSDRGRWRSETSKWPVGVRTGIAGDTHLAEKSISNPVQ
jgi:hypothetical protein